MKFLLMGGIFVAELLRFLRCEIGCAHREKTPSKRGNYWQHKGREPRSFAPTQAKRGAGPREG
ncbi:MAG: hypothetical protein V4754_07550 [Pseudomonadota bacterium]